jgi:hypothetical protein
MLEDPIYIDHTAGLGKYLGGACVVRCQPGKGRKWIEVNSCGRLVRRLKVLGFCTLRLRVRLEVRKVGVKYTILAGMVKQRYIYPPLLRMLVIDRDSSKLKQYSSHPSLQGACVRRLRSLLPNHTVLQKRGGLGVRNKRKREKKR